MGKIPCRQCAGCGLYNDLSVLTCACGADLSGIPAYPVDEEAVAAQCGQVDRDLPVYVQKCSACGAENFTVDPEKPVRTCFNCHKARVAAVAPVRYGGGEGKQAARQDAAPAEEPEALRPAVREVPQEAEADEEVSRAVARWRMVLKKTETSVGAVPLEEKEEPAPPAAGDAGDDDDDDAIGGWGHLLGEDRPAPEPAAAAGRELTLTALRHGRLSFTLTAGRDALPLLLGRSAGCAEFLRQDLRVGNEHCYLDYQNGGWVVIDNHSANGTAVNGRFLELNGRRDLRDGDELMLGHHPDSMAFRVSIR